MPQFHFSSLAEDDLRSIALYTFQSWGEAQAVLYIDNLKACCALVAQSPMLGRSCDKIQRGYRRIEHGSHVVFYRIDGDGIFIGRILHRRMLPSEHVIDGA